MVSSCCVVGCTNRVRRDNGKRFFRFPKVNKNHLPTLQKLTSERREKWISAVNRKSSSGKEINYNGLRVCSDHFTLGKYFYILHSYYVIEFTICDTIIQH